MFYLQVLCAHIFNLVFYLFLQHKLNKTDNTILSGGGDYGYMENNRFMQTKFDSMVTNQTMQLVKAIIPYIDNNLATVLGVYIKFIELENTFRVNQNVSISAMNANHKGLESMLEDIKEFLNDGDKETLETLMTVMEMMNMDDGAKQDILSGYMDMFGM